ncbi:hypothetical protein FQA39_LY10480 [Lamprigera yunnana]|nr:hypothetical protein FQA39_LY10480 [Lamprigera yunnana]
MNFRIFTVKYITSKTSFCYLSQKNSKYFDAGIAVEVNNDRKYIYFSAQPLSTLKDNEIGINRLQAQVLEIKENGSVLVNIRHNVPKISKIIISPTSFEDYEVLEILSENVQSTLLNQLRVVNKNQKFVIWISDALHLTVNVGNLSGYITLWVDSPSFEEEFNSLMQVSDKSDSEGDFEEYMISEGELLQHHESDQDEDLQESQITPEDVDSDSFDDEDNVPFSELRGSNSYYDGINRDMPAACFWLDRHHTNNLNIVEPVDLGRLGFLTEISVAPPKVPISEDPKIENINKQSIFDFINYFQKEFIDTKGLESKNQKIFFPFNYRLQPLSSLALGDEKIENKFFIAYIHHKDAPKSLCSGDMFQLNTIIPPAINNSHAEESGIVVKTVVIRLQLIDNCNEALKCFTPVLYVHECIFNYFNVEFGAKAFLDNCFEMHPLVNNIEIHTNKVNLKDAVSKFKLFVNDNCQKEGLLLNSEVPIRISNYQLLVKFHSATFCLLDSNLIRNCQFTVVEADLDFQKIKQNKLTNYCDIFGNFKEIINNILKGITNLSFNVETENTLLIGTTGSGKTLLTKTLGEKLLLCPFHIHIEFILCKTIKGKSLDSLSRIFATIFINLINYQPSLLILDDVHILCEKVVVGDALTPESLHFSRVSEMLNNLLEANLKTNKISLIATCNSLLNLNECIFPSRGQHLFKNVHEIEKLSKMDRFLALKYLFNEKMETENFNLEYFAQKTEGFVMQDFVDFVDKAIFEALKEDKSRVNIKHCEFALKNLSALSLKNVQLHSSGAKGFSDIGGLENVKNILVESMLWPLQYSNLFDNAPLRLQSGFLLYGPPGTGKTILAGAAAKHCGLRLISIKGPELLSKYIGASEQSVRDIFEKAQSAKPCILFFDEFDSLAPRRGHDSTGVTDRVVNQLLTQLDGVESLNGVCVLAATSRPDLLDPALLRPGRLDKQILCSLPNMKDRVKILKCLSKKIILSSDIDLQSIAEKTTGYTGADLQAVLYTAQLSAAEEIELNEFKGRVDDVMKVNQNQLEEALRNTRPSLSKEETFKYKKIYSKFKSGSDVIDIRSGLQKATHA